MCVCVCVCVCVTVCVFVCLFVCLGVCLAMCVLSGEGRKTEHISFSQLYSRVQQLAVALKAAGVNEGDRVAGKSVLLGSAL